MKYLLSDVAESENAHVEPDDNCHPSEGIVKQPLAPEENRRVCRIAHGVVKRVGYDRTNVAGDHQPAHLASVVEVTERVKVET